LEDLFCHENSIYQKTAKQLKSKGSNNVCSFVNRPLLNTLVKKSQKSVAPQKVAAPSSTNTFHTNASSHMNQSVRFGNTATRTTNTNTQRENDKRASTLQNDTYHQEEEDDDLGFGNYIQITNYK
jgi:hypothetical protein